MSEKYIYSSPRGLSEKIVKEISFLKNEPVWMRDLRLEALKIFFQKKIPTWGVDLSEIDFKSLRYFIRPSEKPALDWKNVPETIKKTFDRLGIPEAEQKFLGGVSAQYESEAVYHNLKKEWKKTGVIFCDTDSALKKYPEIFKKYFGRVVPAADNKFAALNSAVWSGGAFLYAPAGVKISSPLHSYFRINAKNMGQFERTLIIAEENSDISYIEGCSAPAYSKDSLHAGVVEIIAKKGARVRYTTLQNWSKNVYNLTTKRALGEEGSLIEWIDANFGSRATMKYPSVILYGPQAKASIISIALAGGGQHQDTGAKIFHLAPETSSRIVSKSIVKDGGRVSFRGLVKVAKGAKKSRVKVSCHSLLLDKNSRADAYPVIDAAESQTEIEHEAAVSKLSKEQLFYLASRGIKEADGAWLIVSGFVDQFTQELPMEYGAELNRLLRLEMEGSVG
ncbi:MAG: Fe-S cluster assembly protein SufB [Patescibacteria group bacterium]